MEAVYGEPVSGLNTLVTGKVSGKSLDSGNMPSLIGSISLGILGISVVILANSLKRRTGNIRESRKVWTGQFSSCKSGPRFREHVRLVTSGIIFFSTRRTKALNCEFDCSSVL